MLSPALKLNNSFQEYTLFIVVGSAANNVILAQYFGVFGTDANFWQYIPEAHVSQLTQFSAWLAVMAGNFFIANLVYSELL